MSWFRRASREELPEQDVETTDGDAAEVAQEATSSEVEASGNDTAAAEPATDDTAAGDTATDGEVQESRADSGPWDVADRPEVDGRVDLGALRIPGIDGMQVRMEIDQRTKIITGVSIALRGTVLQLQAFAAPRVEAVWPDIRKEIAASATSQGGTADEVPGPFGTELLARLPFTDDQGRSGHRPARFIGVDGPRWFVRAVLSGRAVVEPEAASEFEALIAETVVVRGTDARPPRDVLGLTLPEGAPEPKADGEAAAPRRPQASDFDPLADRGPEITEVR